MFRCFKIHPQDNVATLLDDAPTGPVEVLNAGAPLVITAREEIKIGHKVALADIPAGGQIMKFGTSVGHASQPIAAGAWVHLHNCRSDFDERSSTLDNVTGAPTDTSYV
jgi:altronate dehydratase small subunit